VVIIFIIYNRLCFQHRLIQYLVIQLFRFYNEEKVDPTPACAEKFSARVTRTPACDAELRVPLGLSDENKLDQILEILTLAQGYLMFFNKRGLTVSSLVSLSIRLLLNNFLSPQCSSFVPRPTVIFRKILDRGHSYLRSTRQVAKRYPHNPPAPLPPCGPLSPLESGCRLIFWIDNKHT
jgi:hypothetical protein